MANQEREPLLNNERGNDDDDDQQHLPSSENSRQFVQLENRLQNGRFTTLERLLFAVSIFLFIFLAVFVGLYTRRIYDDHDGAPTPAPPPHDNKTTPLCLTPECVLTAAEVLQDIDLTVDPCEDFYAYSCNNWQQHHNIPEGKSSVGSFDSLATANKEVLRGLLSHDFESFYEQIYGDEMQDNLPDPEKLVDKQNFAMVKNMYDSCMNEAVIDNKGAEPLLPLVNEIRDLYPGDRPLTKNLTRAIATLVKNGVDPLFDLFVDSDATHPENNALQVIQAGLTLPSKEYYKNDDITSAMHDTIEATLDLVFTKDWSKKRSTETAKMVVAFETTLASISDDYEDLMDPVATYNPRTLSQLSKLSPSIDWDLLISYLQPSASPHQDSIIVTSPHFLAKVSTELLEKSSPEAIWAYLTWRTIRTYVDALGEDLRKPSDQLLAKIQGTNAKVTQPRWETCLQQVDNSLGFMAGRLFVQQKFGGNAKDRADDFIDSIKQIFLDRLPELEWLDDATRTKAVQKVNNLISKIGYPTKTPNIMSPVSLSEYYSGLHVSGDDYFGNYLASLQFGVKKEWQKVGTETDKSQWLMNPQEVNAYYNPTINEIVFPAGILQNPFFSSAYPDYLNYGGIGVVVGHELTHGFDSMGRHYDANGRLVEWWTNTTAAAFDEKAKCFVKQYSNFTVDASHGEKIHVKGKQTLGENLADNGGLGEAYLAWKKRYDGDRQCKKYNNQRLPGLDELTPNKLFFVNFGRVWCNKMTEERAKQRVLTDEHSPAKWRVNGAVQNSKHFAEVFGCRAGTPMNPTSKCELW